MLQRGWELVGFCTGFARIPNLLCYPVIAQELKEFSASEKQHKKCCGKLLFVTVGSAGMAGLLFYTSSSWASCHWKSLS